MQKRLCGREQEYGVKADPGFVGDKSNFMEEIAFGNWRSRIVGAIIKEINFQPAIPSVICPRAIMHCWLSNGGLFYCDQNAVEAASAEYEAGSFDGLLQEKASELILLGAIPAVMEKLGLKSLSFYKNTVGPELDRTRILEASYASHHNYSYLAEKRRHIYDLLANFLPVSLLISGSGHIGKIDSKAHYLFSQKANHIVAVESSDTIMKRPLINTRDEPLMGSPDRPSNYRRLHLISRDATRCEFQTWLVDTVTHLILRLVEEGWKLPNYQKLINPLKTLKQVNSSLASIQDCRVELGSMRHYHTMDLFDYNYLFLNAAKQLNPLSEIEKKCLQEWERVLELVRAGAFDKLVGELDWTTKLWLLEKKMSQRKFGLGDARAWKIAMNYHNISTSTEESWFARLDEDGYIKHLVSREDIERAKVVAPSTRAESRGKLVALCNKNSQINDLLEFLDWNSARIHTILPAEHQYATIYFGELDDPFTPHSSTLEKFCKNFDILKP